jgi:cell division protein FtsB
LTNSREKFGLLGLATAGLAFVVLVHFGFAALQGDFGMVRLIEIEAEEDRLNEELAELEAALAAVKNKTHRLSNRFLDIDLLDEQSRKVLGMARGDEIVIR